MLSSTGRVPPTSVQAVHTSAGGVPSTLANLPAGTLITGTVTGRDAAGQTLLRTDAGTLALATRLDLDRGSVVILRIQGGPTFSATIVSVDGRPPAALPLAPPPAAPASPAAVAAPVAPQAPALTANSLVTAVVVSANPGAGEALRPFLRAGDAAGTTMIGVGSRMTLHVVSTNPAAPGTLLPGAGGGRLQGGVAAAPAGASPALAPASGIQARAPASGIKAPAPAALTPNVSPVQPVAAIAETIRRMPSEAPPATSPRPHGTSSQPAAAAAAPGKPPAPTSGQTPGPAPIGLSAPPGPQAPAPAGARISFGSQAPAAGAPAAAAASGAPGAPAVPLMAAVADTDGGGRPLLNLPFGTVRLETPASVPTGTTLALTVLGVEPEPPPPMAAPATRAEALIAFARDWPALREFVEAVQAIDAGLGEQVAQRAAARPGPNLANAVLFFLAVLRGGDVSAWLGRDAVRVLEQNNRDALVRRVASDLGQIARLADRPASGEWQPVMIPLQDGEALRQLRLFVRGHRRGDDDGDDDGGTRFVVDLELSRLGELQLDGFVHEKRFDLILRSHDPMPDGARREIRAIFDDGLAVGGLAGTLSFHVAGSFPVAPLEEIVAGERSGVLA